MNSEEILLDTVIYHSLFDKKALNNHLTRKAIDIIPANSFGVFVSVKINENLHNYDHKSIIGCKGYFTPSLVEEKKEILFEKLLDVGRSSMWFDSRRPDAYPIEKNINATLEIDFLMRPIFEVNLKDGFIPGLGLFYNNNRLGLIATNFKDKYVTFLPKVFENVGWDKIKEMLFQKGEIKDSNTSIQLFAYNIRQLRKRVHEIMFSPYIKYTKIEKYITFMLSNINLNKVLPFPIAIKGKEIIYDDKEIVRGMALISSMLVCLKVYPNLFSDSDKIFIYHLYSHFLNQSNSLEPQALSFLGNGIPYFDFKEIKSVFCKKILERLPKAEKSFEYGELLLGLKNADCKLNIPYIDTHYSIKEDDSIFYYNWFILSMYYINPLRINEKVIFNYLHQYNKFDLNKVETNVLACGWEIFNFLVNITFDKSIKNLLLQKMFEIFYNLEFFYNERGLYRFKDENEGCRLDITFHVINGWINDINNK